MILLDVTWTLTVRFRDTVLIKKSNVRLIIKVCVKRNSRHQLRTAGRHFSLS